MPTPADGMSSEDKELALKVLYVTDSLRATARWYTADAERVSGVPLDRRSRIMRPKWKVESNPRTAR